jgi:hypothetical protein
VETLCGCGSFNWEQRAIYMPKLYIKTIIYTGSANLYSFLKSIMSTSILELNSEPYWWATVETLTLAKYLLQLVQHGYLPI